MRSAWRAICLGAAAFMAGSSVAATAQVIDVNAGNRTISVTAHADAEQRADQAVVHIGYQIYGPTSVEVTATAAKLSQAIMAAVTQAGVVNDAVGSESQSTGPTEAYQENGLTSDQKAARRFQANQSWTVRVDAGNAANVFAAAVSAGANQSGFIDWAVRDDTALSARAASRALQEAKSIAGQMAEGLNAKLGMLLYASNQAEPLRVLPMMSRAIAKSETEPTLSLSPPMVTRSATVSAVFAIQ
jgi:uncharacterized protein YggE